MPQPVILMNTVENGKRHMFVQTSSMVCSRTIDIVIDEESKVIENVEYTRGCSGNLQGVCSLLRGMTVKQAIDKLDGILCNGKMTSCPDQLARVLKTLENN